MGELVRGIVRAPREVQRILTRLALEREMAGWSIQALCREVGVHRSVVDRWESGTVNNPLLSIVAALCEPLGLRLELVSERHRPLMVLDEYEIQALVEAATRYGWRTLPELDGEVREPGQLKFVHLRSALKKIGKVPTTEKVSSDG